MNNKGFSLIEMLGCVALLGIILCISLFINRKTLATSLSTLDNISNNEIYKAPAIMQKVDEEKILDEEMETVTEVIVPSDEEKILGATDEVVTRKVVDYTSIKKRYKVHNLKRNRIYETKKNVEEFNISKLDNNIITGTINVSDDSYFVTSIPYDEGFTVKVDDKIGEYSIVNKAFLGFPISKGEHRIEIIYNAPWFDFGKVVSILGFVLFGIILYYDFIKKKNK